MERAFLDRRQLLNTVPLFSALSVRDWAEIEKLIYERSFAKSLGAIRERHARKSSFVARLNKTSLPKESS